MIISVPVVSAILIMCGLFLWYFVRFLVWEDDRPLLFISLLLCVIGAVVFALYNLGYLETPDQVEQITLAIRVV